MKLDDFNPSFRQIAVAMVAVFLVITGINALVAPDGGYAGDFADTVSNSNNDNTDDQRSENDSEDESDPYFDKAQNEDSSSGTGSDDGDDSGSLNETERTKIENDFEGHVNNTERDDGVYLDRRAVADEGNKIQVMYDGDPVEGADVLVNGESIGSTGPTGGVYFQVPNADSITVRTSTENLGTVEESFGVTQ